jgi:hypothetical protein
METKLLGLIACVTIGGLCSIEIANADTITIFDVTGSFASDENLTPPFLPLPTPPLSFGGTLTIDVTIGSVTASDLIIPDFSPLNIVGSQGTSPNSTGLLYVLDVSNSQGDSGSVVFINPNVQLNPLIGHNVIDIDQGEFTAASGLIPFGLTGDITATPLPPTWTMQIAGFVGLGFFAYRGAKKKAAALAAG